jgi:hypothetical protein
VEVPLAHRREHVVLSHVGRRVITCPPPSARDQRYIRTYGPP